MTTEAARTVLETYLGKDGDWEVRLSSVATFIAAIDVVEANSELELVFITNETSISRAELARGCEALAKALSAHPNKPWVMFNDESFNFLAAVFRDWGIIVAEGDVERVMRQRHESGSRRVQLS